LRCNLRGWTGAVLTSPESRIWVYYLREVRNLQPRGPYCFAGYSFGGYVIFEMAQQLHVAGETTALLGFMDTVEWQYHEGISHPEDFRKRWVMRLNRLRYRPREYVTDTVSSLVTRMVYRAFEKLGYPLPQRVSTLEKINRLAMSQYRPTIYPGHLTIFRSVSRDLASGADDLLGWGVLVTGGIEVLDVTGSHLEMLNEPNVRVLAEKLRICLDRIQIPAQQPRSPGVPDPETESAALAG